MPLLPTAMPPQKRYAVMAYGCRCRAFTLFSIVHQNVTLRHAAYAAARHYAATRLRRRHATIYDAVFDATFRCAIAHTDTRHMRGYAITPPPLFCRCFIRYDDGCFQRYGERGCSVLTPLFITIFVDYCHMIAAAAMPRGLRHIFRHAIDTLPYADATIYEFLRVLLAAAALP